MPVSVDCNHLWTQTASDPSDERTYILSDQAGNHTELVLRVRCEPDEYEVSVSRLRYHADAVRRPHNPQYLGCEHNCGLSDHSSNDKCKRPCPEKKPSCPIQNNTLTYRHCHGYNGKERPLLGVLERVSLGQGDKRETV
jgi:hypothetical protein